MFAAYMAPGSSTADIKRTAANLVSTLDTDRSGKLSFEEFAFRFGRKLQMEIARQRRAKTPATPARDNLAEEIVCSADSLRAPLAGAYMRRAAAAPSSTQSGSPSNAQAQAMSNEEPATAHVGSWSRETLTVLGIALSLLALLAFAVFAPAPSETEVGSGARTRSRSQGRTHGR